MCTNWLMRVGGWLLCGPELPEGIGQLTALQILSVWNNHLTGERCALEPIRIDPQLGKFLVQNHLRGVTVVMVDVVGQPYLKALTTFKNYTRCLFISIAYPVSVARRWHRLLLLNMMKLLG